MPNELVTIRTAALSDIEWLLEVAATTFFDAYIDAIPADVLRNYIQEAFTLETLLAELNDPATSFLVAEVGDVPVGYATLNRGTSPPGVSGDNPIELQRIYVLKDQIGKGIGALLMQACLEAAKQLGCKVIWLGVWEHNHRAQEFYRKWGFEFCGEHNFQLGNILQTDLLMQRDINTPL